MDKTKLLELLKDNEIQAVIKEIVRDEKRQKARPIDTLIVDSTKGQCSAKQNGIAGKVYDSPFLTDEEESTHQKWRKKYNDLEKQFNELTCKYQNLGMKFEHSESEQVILQSEYEKLKQYDINLESQNDAVIAKLKLITDSVHREQERNQNLEKTMQDMHEKMEQYQIEIRDIEEKYNEQKQQNGVYRNQLSQRFDKGWTLYEAYQKIDSHTQQLLRSVFPRLDFMAFICGGSQDGALGKIWDVMKECLLKGRNNDAKILWDIFVYCIELVNASKMQTIYQIASVKKGDAFDVDDHLPAVNSRAQGRVQDIYLRGYINVYSKKTERKSIVNIG